MPDELFRSKFKLLDTPVTRSANFVDILKPLEDNYTELSVNFHTISGSFTNLNLGVDINPTYDDELLWSIVTDQNFVALAYPNVLVLQPARRIRLRGTATGGAATFSVRYAVMQRFF